MTAAPYHWIKKIEHSLEEAQKIPLWGNTPSFPWEQCQNALRIGLELPTLIIEHKEPEWRSADELLEGMGRHPMHTTFELAPLSGHLHWIFSNEDLSTLVAATLANESLLKGFSDKGLEEGYFSYLALQAMQAVDSTKAFPQLSLKLSPKAHLPKEGGLCVDVNIQLGSKSVWGRLVCPSPFLHSFRRHFKGHKPAGLTSDLYRNLDINLHMQVGATELLLDDLKGVKVGDFIFLDRCSIDPSTKQGSLTVALYNAPLFEASISGREITLTDYSHYKEEEGMAKEFYEDQNDDEDLDDEEFEDEDDDFDDEEFDDEEEFDEDEEEEEDDDEIESSAKESADEGWSLASEASPVEQAIATHNIPVTLTLEVARMQMNLEKLLQLQPGNILHLKTSIDQPLDVRMNGKKIGQAELVKIGDMLGMKILHIGAV